MGSTVAGFRNAYILTANSYFFKEHKLLVISIYFILVIGLLFVELFESDENLTFALFFDVEAKIFKVLTSCYHLANALAFLLSKIIFIYLLHKPKSTPNSARLTEINQDGEMDDDERSNEIDDDIFLLPNTSENSEALFVDVTDEISVFYKLITFSFYIISWLLLLLFTDVLGLHSCYQKEVLIMDFLFSSSLLIHAFTKSDSNTFIALVMKSLEKTNLTFNWNQKLRCLTFVISLLFSIYFGYYRLYSQNHDQNFLMYLLLTIVFFLAFIIHLSFFAKIYFCQRKAVQKSSS